jgi:outer membrane protein OmpA-like peptidoglycan-associated protein
MKTRLVQATIVLAAVMFGAALTAGIVSVNYEALDRLPPKGAAGQLAAPVLTPPSFISHPPAPPYAAALANRPAPASDVPPVFVAAASGTENLPPESAPEPAAVSAPLSQGVTGASSQGMAGPPQGVTGLYPGAVHRPAVAPITRKGSVDENDEAELNAWKSARPMGKVVFKNNGSELPDLDYSALAELDRLAREFSNAQQRILLRAFAGTAGDESHEAHRVALKRGLAVRRYLISRGVSSKLIDVTAVGGATDGGPLNRVDVMASNT